MLNEFLRNIRIYIRGHASNYGLRLCCFHHFWINWLFMYKMHLWLVSWVLDGLTYSSGHMIIYLCHLKVYMAFNLWEACNLVNNELNKKWKGESSQMNSKCCSFQKWNKSCFCMYVSRCWLENFFFFFFWVYDTSLYSWVVRLIDIYWFSGSIT